MTVGVLCSGNLGFEILKHINVQQDIQFILTDNNSEAIKEYCEKSHIPIFSGNPRNGKAAAFIKDKPVSVVASVNYLFLIEDDIISHPDRLSFNIHGSLLPKYRGRTPHVWAIINGEKKAGITAHIIDGGCDTGQILLQKEIPIEENDTGADILKKYGKAYYGVVDATFSGIENNTLTPKEQDHKKATYFGKRTPKEGKICWNWSKERIYNWVRAQAYPYPGAFTHYEGKKIIIDRITFSDHGFSATDVNGTILQSFPKTIVKTTNGAVCLDAIRTENCTFTTGKLLQ